MRSFFTFGLQYRKVRWVIAVALTVSTILNVIDQQTLSVLAPFLRDRFQLTPQAYSNVVTIFLVAFTVMYTVGGVLVDRFGERVGLAACVLWFSIATMFCSLARGVWGLGVCRFLLGIGAPGNYPAALRACTRWFPKAERGMPIALFSSGSAVGSIIAPPFVAALALSWGWKMAFFLPGVLGLVWLVFWIGIYRDPEQYPLISSTELEFLGDGSKADDGPSPSRLDLLKDGNVIALVLARFVSDPVWLFYLFWIPEYLKRERGFNLSEIGLYAWIPFVGGAIGGLVGGKASDMLIARGMMPAKARTRILYASACMAPLGILTSRVHSAAIAILLIAVMAFVAFAWFINTAAIIPDLFSEKVVGSVLGFMGTAGMAGATLFSISIGFLLTHYSYAVVFGLAGSMHLFASAILLVFLKENVLRKANPVLAT